MAKLSHGRPAKDASLRVSYRTIWRRPEDVMTFCGDLLRNSTGRNFAEWGKVTS